MGIGETEQVIALALTFVVHVMGAVLLIWAMLDHDRGESMGGWWPRDRRPPDEPPQPPGPQRPSLPMPSADSSPVRMREPGRVSEHYPRPPRRPEHAPERTPQRTPEHDQP